MSDDPSKVAKRSNARLIALIAVVIASTGVLLFIRIQRQHKEGAVAQLYRAAELASLNRVDEAERTLRGVDSSLVDAKRYVMLRAAIAYRKKHRIVPYVFDRAGGLLASYDVAHGEVVAQSPDVEPLIARTAGAADASGAATIGAHVQELGTATTLDTTIDPKVQGAALAALTGFRGSVVAIDPRTNEILAIASTRGSGEPANLALERQYEPGSVIKVLTGLNAVDSGVDVPSLFPYQCNGALMIDGQRFGDWVPDGHGRLETIDEALAVSCNIVFADLGLRLGADRLRSFMSKAGFDAQADLGLYSVPLGRLTPPAVTRMDTANLAIGLQHESITTLHLAILASMMANRGVLTAPRLLRSRHTILGDVVRPPAHEGVRVASERAASMMSQAMQAVVTDPRATGRRTIVQGVDVAMKTGTAGSREKGYDALIMAFAPAKSPTIAFAVIAENAGHAELAGAQIARDFLNALFSGAAVPAAARSGSTETPAAPLPAPAGPR